jgi:hypothetical protein
VRDNLKEGTPKITSVSTQAQKKEIEITELEIMVSAYNWTFWRKVLMHMYYFRQFLASMKATVWSPGGNRN